MVHSLAPPLRTVVRTLRLGAPQVPDAPLAELVFTLEGDGIPRHLVAERTSGRGVQRLPHLVIVVDDDV